MTSQKEGVFNAIEAFMIENNKEFEVGAKCTLSTEDRKTVIGMLVSATHANELEVKSKKAQADLNAYWNGTVSNWLRKDTRLNGGSKYVTKNPGSRSSDAQLKNLKLLLIKVKGSEHESDVVEAITKRTEEIAVEKNKAVEIDTSFLPDSLKNLV